MVSDTNFSSAARLDAVAKEAIGPLTGKSRLATEGRRQLREFTPPRR